MSWDGQDLIPISALQHYVFCPRQCALIHVEQTFEENLFTLRGRLAHESIHKREAETDRSVRVERALPLWSDRLGLIGQADLVEFPQTGTPYPVEYKSGRQRKRRKRLSYEVQLCAQAMCLEEMLGCPVPKGALYYLSSRHRTEVFFSEELRKLVEQTVEAVRSLLREGSVPPPVNDARCRDCSLLDVCMPDVITSFGRQTTNAVGLYEVES